MNHEMIILNKGEVMLEYWSCIIGPTTRDRLRSGDDAPMRVAVADRFEKLTGHCEDLLSSGWGMSEDRMQVVNAVNCMDSKDPLYIAIRVMMIGARYIKERL